MGGGTAVHDVDVAHVGSRQPVPARKLESYVFKDDMARFIHLNQV